MNPLLEEIYSTVVPSLPYIIAAYVLIWVVLLVYLFIIHKGTKKAERDIALLEEAVARKQDGETAQ